MSPARTWLAAAVVGVAAFVLYDATLLPGQDLGDTASFEATVGSPVITPRQAYPLYYATGNLFVAAFPGNPARAINLASAVFGALACGLLVVSVAALSGWTLAGVAAGAFLAVSYTFWSQAIIAEVYALHAFVMALCFLALVRWTRHPSSWRLAVFFAVYAVGFGNHLSMILLLPGFTLFLLLAAPGGPLTMIRPRVAVLAVVLAALGASQYLWNLWPVFADPQHDHRLAEILQSFWFDVTKSDWRATMVMGIPEGAVSDRFRMYWFDLRQQFGTPGVGLALAGAVWMMLPGRLPRTRAAVQRWRVGVALLVLFFVNWIFAFTYNVGDTHVFYLPSHFMVAMFVGLGAGCVLTLAGRRRKAGGGRREAEGDGREVAGGRRAPRWAVAIVAVVILAYPAWRAYDTYPALDRSDDWQVTQFFNRLTAGLTDKNSVLAADLNWQLHNGLDYYAKYTRPDLAIFDTNDALLYLPFIVNSNRDIGRPMAITNGAAPIIRTAYGPLYEIVRDARVASSPLAERVRRFPPGTPYVMTFLEAYPDVAVDPDDLNAAIAWLTGGAANASPAARYTLIVGRVGERPSLVRSDARPFRLSAPVGPLLADVRIECWLPADTIRRMGFGRVIVRHAPVLTIDRGLSLVAFNGDGSVKGVEYGWGLLSPQPRWIIPLEK